MKPGVRDRRRKIRHGHQEFPSLLLRLAQSLQQEYAHHVDHYGIKETALVPGDAVKQGLCVRWTLVEAVSLPWFRSFHMLNAVHGGGAPQ